MPAQTVHASPARRAVLGVHFWRYYAANVVSNLGDGVALVAYPWLAATLTRDPLLVSGAMIANRLPWLLAALPIGVLVDRCDRRTLMVVAALARAGLTALVVGLVLTDGMSIGLLYLCAFLLGLGEVTYDLSATASLPDLVPPAGLERANGLLWAAQMGLNQLVGPPLGGVLLGATLAAPFVLDSVTFLAAVPLLLLIPQHLLRGRPGRADVVDVESTGGPFRTALREVGEGVRLVWGAPLLRALGVSQGMLNGVVTMTLATLVLFAQEVVGLTSDTYGLVLGCGAVGGMAGSLLGSRLVTWMDSSTVLRLMFPVGLVGNALLATTSSPVVMAASYFGLTFFAMAWNVVAVSTQQRVIPAAVIGRAMSVGRWMSWGMMSVGALAGGSLVGLVEPVAGRDTALRAPFVVAAAAFLLVGAWAFRHFRRENFTEIAPSS